MSDEPTQPEEDAVEEAEAFDVENATDDQLRERAAALKDQIEELKAQPRTLDTARQILDLRTERNTVVKAVNAMLEMDGELDADLPALDTEPDTGDDQTPTDEAADAESDTPQEAPVSEDATPDVPESPGDSPELVEAAENLMAESAHVAGVKDRPLAPENTRARTRAAYVAGAGQQAFAQGVELDDAGMARAWESVRTGLKPGPNGASRAVVANLRSFEEEGGLPGIEQLSAKNSVTRNDELIAESVAAWRAKRNGEQMEAHVAAICDPLDIIREIPYGGETDTPFAEVFPQRPISRLGFQYTEASSISVAASGVATWTESDQSSVDASDPSTWKPTVMIECSTPSEIKAEEITTSATVDTSTEMSSPERVAEFMHKLAVARARHREQYVLGLFDATASPYTLTGTFGAMASLTQAVHTVLPQLLYTERLSETEYDLVLDPGYFNKLVIDECVKCDLPAEDVKAKIQREIGLNVVVLRDFVGANPFQTPPTPGGGASALTDLPAANRVRIVPAGAYIYGATGEQSTGWQTDPQLARQNRMQAFSQEWLLLAKHGEHPAAYIDITSDANGARGGCVTPS